MAYTTKIQLDKGGDRIVVASGGTLLAESGSTITIPAASLDSPTIVQNVRVRAVIATVNTGFTLVAAQPGKSIRMISCKAIAYGAAVTTLTSVDVSGDDGSAAILVSFLQASLTQSAVLKDGGTGATVLADGASYVANTAGVAITAKTVGTAGAGATGIDFIISYAVE
jgi:hypothetical protein